MPDLPDAHIIEAGQQCFKVRPGVAAVRRAAGFHLRNITRHWVTLQFPEGLLVADSRLAADLDSLRRLFPDERANLLASAIRWVGPNSTIDLTFAEGREGVYDYSATVLTDRGPVDAAGESAPKVIIDP